MILRKSANDAANQAVFSHMDELGADLLVVSAHKGARPLCAKDQGQVFSRSGFEGTIKDGNGEKVTVRSWASSTYGEAAGILGINCRHHIAPFFEGRSVNTQEIPDDEENARLYKLEQKQREMEREIRKSKRHRDVATALGDEEERLKWVRKSRAQSKELQRFVDENGLTRAKMRERVLINPKAYNKEVKSIEVNPDELLNRKAINSTPVKYADETKSMKREGSSKHITIDFKESISSTNKIGISTKVKRMQDENVNYSDETFSKVFKLFDEKLDTSGMERPFLLILDESEMPQGQLAAYNPRSNTIFLRAGAVDDHSILDQLQRVKKEGLTNKAFLACEDDPLATPVHEVAHWYYENHTIQKLELESYTKDDQYDMINEHSKEIVERVEQRYPGFDFNAISPYADKSANTNPEEVIAESFTRELLGKTNQEVKAVVEEVLK